jgi:3-oxoacyl-[acyl-carrier protein] reductase
MFAELQGRIDALDILVNNAGRGSGGFPTLEQITPADYDSTFALNARAVFFVTQQAVKLMRDGGRVITISSMAPHVRYAGLGTYAASKAAADSFTRTWATELASRQITVNSVNSGIVETEMVAQMDPSRKAELIAKIPLGRIGQTRDIADVVAFLASDESRWISGAEIPVSGGRYW